MPANSLLWLAMIPKNESPDGFAGKYINRGVL